MTLKTNLRENILALQFVNEWSNEVKDNIRQDTMKVPNYEGKSIESDGLLGYNNIIYVPTNDKLRNLILREAHRAVYMAHPGVTKMKEELKPLFLWKGMKIDIVNYMVRCLEC
jgi:hypothetical protein